MEIASRSRGTPRIANRLLKRVRDFAQVLGVEVIDRQLADEALAKLEVDRYGFDRNDRKILTTIVKTLRRRSCRHRNDCRSRERGVLNH